MDHHGKLARQRSMAFLSNKRRRLQPLLRADYSKNVGLLNCCCYLPYSGSTFVYIIADNPNIQRHVPSQSRMGVPDIFPTPAVTREGDVTIVIYVWSIKLPVNKYFFCGTNMWIHEHLAKSGPNNTILFGICCMSGKVTLPLLPIPPPLLMLLLDGSDDQAMHYQKHIRSFNGMFSFISMSEKIQYTINKETAPPMFVISSQNYHSIRSLMPQQSNKPKFAQLYFYDTGNEVQNIIDAIRHSGEHKSIDRKIVAELRDMLDSHNSLAKSFWYARQRFAQDSMTPLRLCLIKKRSTDGRRYNLSSTSEVAALIVGDFDTKNLARDVIIETHSNLLKRIDVNHPQYAGYPSYFITITCNPEWNEVKECVAKYSLKHISAEIPDEHMQPKLYKLVQKFMVHVPCGVLNMSSPCMVKEKCSKFYPMAFHEKTVIDNAVSQSNDRVTASFFRSHNSNDSVVTVDEIQNYYDCRYISTCEDSWRLFGFEIQFKEPNVIRLPFHLLNEQNILYEDHQLIENVIESAESKDNMFIGWMEVNNKFDAARRLTFAEMPSYFVWDKQGHIWKPRKQGHVIGRLIHIPQSHREEYYLHMLLNYQKGCQTFADIQSVDGVVHDTYKQACYAIGLLQDDKKFIDAINEASFERFANEIMSTTLAKIEELLQLNGRTLKEFSDLPFPDLLDSVEPRDTVFLDELNFNKNELATISVDLVSRLNQN
ncbi:uncharacterized protein [Arachis hypogaea]|uniref:uncharacterized protein n=1 Tax=Arachis hypogaea TaxID=3818 RepID=UPI003B225801